MCFFFFFQAEDGIRDIGVTGVQTCALPICAFKEVSRIAGAFVGVIVGAGFASGQEILQFFAGFGAIGLAGCLVAAQAFVFLSDRKSGGAGKGVDLGGWRII